MLTLGKFTFHQLFLTFLSTEWKILFETTHMKVLSSMKLNSSCTTFVKFNLQKLEASNLTVSIYIPKSRQGDQQWGDLIFAFWNCFKLSFHFFWLFHISTWISRKRIKPECIILVSFFLSTATWQDFHWSSFLKKLRVSPYCCRNLFF